MMKNSFCALAVCAITATSVQAVDSVQLQLTGKIAPSACTPTLVNGGVIDYGDISAADLKYSDLIVLPEKSIGLSISCSAPTSIALAASSNRKGTTALLAENASGIAQHPSTSAAGRFQQKVGLGLTAGGEKIGGYSMWLQDAKIGGVNAHPLFSDDLGSNWTNLTPGSYMGFYNAGISNARYMSVAATATSTPSAISQLTGNIGVQAYITKASELDLSQPISLDGQSNIEIIYL